jgi:hypothetical protein
MLNTRLSLAVNATQTLIMTLASMRM